MDPYAMRSNSSLAIALLALAAPAFASVSPNLTIVSPATNSTVSTPFLLNAAAAPCSSQPITAMGYSIDSSSNTAVVKAASVNVRITSSTGAHLLHVKSWGNRGAVCVTDVPINVVQAQPAALITNIAVNTPANDAAVTTPFPLIASATQCQSQSIAAMGYSIDTSANTTVVNGVTVNAQVASPTGTHTLHVKAWGTGGASCVTNLTLYVSAPPVAAPGPTIPSSAIVLKSIQNLSDWQATFDTATGSSAQSSGAMSLVASPALSGSARMFDTTYSNYGGERYSARIGVDTTSQNFVYDAWVYLASPISDIANIEMDMNQVIANGDTIIYAFQCDGWSHTWDYTTNSGTRTNPTVQWLHSNQSCNPQQWSPNAWHHVQIAYSRDNSGNVTYQAVWLDGVQQVIGETVNSDFALGWGPTMVTNFQIDGFTSTPGSSTTYLDNVTVYRW